MRVARRCLGAVNRTLAAHLPWVKYAVVMIRYFRLICVLLASTVSPVMAQDGVAPEYDRYGHALIMDQQGWLYVDRDQRPVLRPFLYDNGPDYYEEGLARFVDNGKMGFHNEALHIVVPAVYDFAFPFENGEAKAGMNCTFHPIGEHSSVSCQHWETLRNPMRPNGKP